MISTSLMLKKISQTITAIYDIASSMTQLTSGANVFRRVFVQKDDNLNIYA